MLTTKLKIKSDDIVRGGWQEHGSYPLQAWVLQKHRSRSRSKQRFQVHALDNRVKGIGVTLCTQKGPAAACLCSDLTFPGNPG